jgi:ABC-type nickel/cobalt efflux system permease component RcnA
MLFPGAMGGALLGLVLGARHALEPDHLAAISTVVAERPRARAAAWIGAAWGLGHALALVLLGGTLLLLRAELPARAADALELGVAVMLMGLGLRAVILAVRTGRLGAAARAPHAHGAVRHEHDGPAEHLHLLRWTVARRPLVIGLIHGLAGSGALTTLALASMPSRVAGLVYIVLFGAGSALGMALMTGASAWSLARLVGTDRAQARLSGMAGLVSLGVGGVWAAPLLARLGG